MVGGVGEVTTVVATGLDSPRALPSAIACKSGGDLLEALAAGALGRIAAWFEQMTHLHQVATATATALVTAPLLRGMVSLNRQGAVARFPDLAANQKAPGARFTANAFQLRQIGVDGPAICRLFEKHSRNLIQRWIKITDAALHERPRGFPGFRVSPAAFLIDGVQHGRTPPDWMYLHEKRQERKQWEQHHTTAAADEQELRTLYQRDRDNAFQAFLQSAEGCQKYEQTFAALLELHRVTDPERFREAAREATLARLERMDFRFPDYAPWALTRQTDSVQVAS